MIKPIETTWGGYRFRSRTEARWGMALSLSGVRFDYELNGFDLPSGWYLPDFWLPTVKAWLEIKGIEPDDRELQLGKELSAQSGQTVLFGVGSPADAQYLTCIDDGLVAETGWQTVFGSDNPKVGEAMRRVRAERFDGKPISAAPNRPRRHW